MEDQEPMTGIVNGIKDEESGLDENDVGVIRPKGQLEGKITVGQFTNKDGSQTNSKNGQNKNENAVTGKTNEHKEEMADTTPVSDAIKGSESEKSDIKNHLSDKEDLLSSVEPSTSKEHLDSSLGDGLRHRSTVGSKSQDQEIQDGAAEMLNGQLLMEEDDDDSAWEDADYDDDEEEEENIEDDKAHAVDIPYPGVHVEREENPELPETVATLTTDCGSKVYVVGTAHFSESSQDDVSKTIQATQPDIVMVELCNSRVNILQLDEETLLEEAKNINMDKVKSAIRQSGMVQGIMHLLLLSMSAHLTKQLGMAPGGEFRRAFKEAQKIPGCRIHLGDRPIQVTLRRALGSLSLWQKTRLAWYMITSKEPISKEDVEKCKDKDLLEEMLREMTGEFPALSAVFVKERDMFLANSLRIAAKPIPNPNTESGTQPAVVVGVVGIGHLPGIVENWGTQANMRELMKVPPTSTAGLAMKWSIRAVLLGALSWSCYKLYRLGANVVSITYRNLPPIKNK